MEKWRKKEGRERRSQGNGRERENFLLVEGASSWYNRVYKQITLICVDIVLTK